MSRHTLTAVAALAVGSLLAAASAPALAQTTKAQQPPAEARGGANEEAATTQEQEQPQVPVLLVTSIEVMRSVHEPILDVVRVRGITSTEGWTDAELEPITEGTPSDGILDMVLVARMPAGSTQPTGFVPIEAIFPLESDHPFKGIRVRSGSNSIVLKTLPGYAEGKPINEDCSKCVGKLFLPTGTPLPAGRNMAEAVRQEDLPATVRIVNPSDGIASKEHDANRLTIVIGEDGSIVDAGWD